MELYKYIRDNDINIQQCGKNNEIVYSFSFLNRLNCSYDDDCFTASDIVIDGKTLLYQAIQHHEYEIIDHLIKYHPTFIDIYNITHSPIELALDMLKSDENLLNPLGKMINLMYKQHNYYYIVQIFNNLFKSIKDASNPNCIIWIKLLHEVIKQTQFNELIVNFTDEYVKYKIDNDVYPKSPVRNSGVNDNDFYFDDYDKNVSYNMLARFLNDEFRNYFYLSLSNKFFVNVLKDIGLNINYILCYYVFLGQYRIVEYILDNADIDLNFTTKLNMCPYHFLNGFKLCDDNIIIFDILFKQNYPVNIISDDGITAKDILIKLSKYVNDEYEDPGFVWIMTLLTGFLIKYYDIIENTNFSRDNISNIIEFVSKYKTDENLDIFNEFLNKMNCIFEFK